MRKWLLIIAGVLLPARIASVEAAQSWSVTGEEKARFDAKVVDVLGELTGDCPAECGAGRRQRGRALRTPVENH